MTSPSERGPFGHVREDLPAGLVVFLVAVPLCLGIAQASGAPLLGGLIAGIVGGTVVALLSGSPLSVSGPAAGLAVIVAAGIQEVGLRAFLLAVVLAGVIQLVIGALRLGAVAHFFPSAVIKGMLAAIGILIILKQVPHAVGFDRDFEGDEAFFQPDGGNTFGAIVDALGAFLPGAIVISIVCTALILGWPRVQGMAKQLKLVPPALVAVVGGAVTALVVGALGWRLEAEHMVSLPVFSSLGDIADAVLTPDFSRITDPAVLRIAVTLAIVASLETLLSLEAVDRLDPHRRISPPNRELLAQGVGNVISGLIGGLPITSVIVRSSANVQAGGRTRLAAIAHGLLLLVGLLAFATVLNQIPLAALAVVLIVVGFKLTTPTLWRSMWNAGLTQFIPFAVTIAAIVFTDLLKGTLFGVAVGLLAMIRKQQKNAIEVSRDHERHLVKFTKDLTFLQKARIKEVLREIPEGASIVLDRSTVDYVDDDIEEILQDFVAEAPERDMRVELIENPNGARKPAKARAASAH